MEYSVGMMIELVSKANVGKFTTNDLVNLKLTPEILRRRKSYKLKVGSVGYIDKIDDDCIDVIWENGTQTCVIPRIDMIREVKMPVRVYRRCRNFYLDDWELADVANTVHKIAGGNGEPFTASMMRDRLKGHHCSCGVNIAGYTKGVFELLPFASEEVKAGGKAYMICKKCGCMSHL